MNKKAFLIFSTAALSVCVFFTSCLPDNDDDNAVSTLAKIMVVNAQPGSVGQDFYIDDILQNSSPINYNMASPYYQSATGLRNLKINRSQSAQNILDINMDLDLSGDYSLFTLDTVGSIRTIFTADDLTEPVLGKSHLRFVQGSHNTGSIDIINLADSSVIFSNIGFRQHTAFKPLDAGAYSLGYRLLGDSNIAAIPLAVNLGNRKIYTMVLSGFNTDTSGTAVSSLNVNFIDNGR